ncbi:MAG: hypothetical protein V4511_05035 [Bacteroidota bacterium]
METEEIINGNDAPKRPTFLTILCVLSFISGGLGSLSALITPMFSDLMIEFLKNSPNYDETLMEETIMLLQAGWGYYLITFVFAMCSLVGVFFMWKLKKIGFHFYALSNLGLLFAPMLMFDMAISWAGIFLTASFILLYAVNLKIMK